MDIFDIKLALSRGVLGDLVISPSRLSRMHEKISAIIQNFEYDERKVESQRNQTINNIKALQETLKRTDEREIKNIEKLEKSEINKYYVQVEKQADDIKKIIELLKKLVESECLEIIYDVRAPLVFFEKFFYQLKDMLKNIQLGLGGTEAGELNRIITNMGDSYDKLVNYTVKFIENDLNYLRRVGVPLGAGVAGAGKLTIAERLKERSEIKKGIDEKMRKIVLDLENAEKVLMRLEKEGVLKADSGKKLVESIAYFKGQFDQLVSFCVRRVEVGSHVIAEAVTMQQDKIKELEEMKKELQALNNQIIQEQVIRVKAKPEARKKEEKLIADLEKGVEKEILKVEKEDLKVIQIEDKKLKKEVGLLSRFSPRFKKIVIGTVAGLALLGTVNQMARGADFLHKELTGPKSTISYASPVVKEADQVTIKIGGHNYIISKNKVYVVCERPESALSRFIVSPEAQKNPSFLNNILKNVGHLGIVFYDPALNAVRVSEQVNFTRTINLNESDFQKSGSFLFEVKGVDVERVIKACKEWDRYKTKTNYFFIGKNCQSHVSKILMGAGLDINSFELLGVKDKVLSGDSEGLYNYFNTQTNYQLKSKLQSSLRALLSTELPFIDKEIGHYLKTGDIKLFHSAVELFSSLYNSICTIYNLFFSHTTSLQEFVMPLLGSSNTFILVGMEQGFLSFVGPAQ
jgi:hypothetical protein